MFQNQELISEVSKAIAGGVAGAVVALGARYGFNADAPTVSAVGVIVTAIVGYVVGHVWVYLAPKNKVTK